jgi:hypothetical protein
VAAILLGSLLFFANPDKAFFSPMKRGEKYFFAIFLNCEKATANKTIATYNLEKIQFN